MTNTFIDEDVIRSPYAVSRHMPRSQLRLYGERASSVFLQGSGRAEFTADGKQVWVTSAMKGAAR